MRTDWHAKTQKNLFAFDALFAEPSIVQAPRRPPKTW
jgi:hypothetical protein